MEKQKDKRGGKRPNAGLAKRDNGQKQHRKMVCLRLPLELIEATVGINRSELVEQLLREHLKRQNKEQ